MPVNCCNPRVAVWGRRFQWLVAVAVLAVVVAGLRQRFDLPLTPILFSDSWGYTKQALAAAIDVPVAGMRGRGFAYSFFLSWVLKATGSFESIVVVQHMVGLAAAACWLGSLWLFLRFLPQGIARYFLSPLAGVALFALWFLNPQTVHFEKQVMAEALLPFTGLAQILCGLVFLWNWKEKKTGAWLFVSGGLLPFFSLLSRELKPSWSLSVLPALALVAAAVCFFPGRGRLVALGAMILGFVLYAGLVLAPQRGVIWHRPELAQDASLGGTLVAVHANLILQDLESGAGQDEAVHALLREEFPRAAANPGSYPALGFDPDYLIYASPVFSKARELGYSDEQLQKLFLRWYGRALLHNPAGFARKWFQQLGFYFLPEPQTLYRYKFRLDRDYAALAASVPRDLAPEIAKWQPVYGRFYERAIALGGREWPVVGHGGMRQLSRVVAVLQAPLFALGMLAAAVSLFARGLRPVFGVGSAALVYVWLCGLGNVAAVAIVHSFEIVRYLHTTNSFTLLALAVSLGFLLSLSGGVFCLFLGRLRPKL